MTITTQVPAGLDEYIEQARRAWRAPGLAIAVVKDDAVVFARGYGVRELGKDDPVDEHTLFAVASTTKAYTAATLGLLVDEGRLSWDDPVIKHLPGFQLYDPYVTREITVRDLLCHRSGLSRGDTLWVLGFSRDEVLRRVRYLKPSWSFRARFGYQNIMFLAASQIVEAVAGVRWDDFLKERLFKPLGMARSNTSVADLERLENVAAPHYQDDDGIRPIPYWNVDNVAGAGAINSSAIEMAQWVRLNLGEGVYAGARVLSAEVVREMQTPQMVINDPEWLKGEALLQSGLHFNTYGLGWALRDYRGRKLATHGGGLWGMRSEVGLIPEAGLGVVVLTNLSVDMGSNDLPNAILFRALDAYLGEPERDWSADYLKAMLTLKEEEEAERRKIEEAHIEGTTPSLPLDAYAGTYRDEMFGDVQVSLEDGRLVARPCRFVGDLTHWHYDTFQIAWRNPGFRKEYAVFTLDLKGKVHELRIEGGAEPLRFRRTPEAAPDDSAAGS